MPSSADRSPLTPLSMHILLVLADRALHGYALMEAVREQSEGSVNPGTGSLYAALQRLVDEGLLEVAETDEETASRRGNTYRLTPAGREAAAEEVRRLRHVLALAEERDLATDPEGA